MQKAKWVLATSLFIVFRLRPDWEGARMIRISTFLRYVAYLSYRNLRKNIKRYLRLVLLILAIIKRIVDLIP